MDEDWRNTFRISDVTPWGRASVAPKDQKFILYKHSHVAYQIKGYEE